MAFNRQLNQVFKPQVQPMQDQNYHSQSIQAQSVQALSVQGQLVQAQSIQAQSGQAQSVQAQSIPAQLFAGLSAVMQQPATVINFYNINATNSSVSIHTVDSQTNFNRFNHSGSSDLMLPVILTDDEAQFAPAPTVGQLSPDFKGGLQPSFGSFDAFNDRTSTLTNRLRESSLILPPLETADRQSSQSSLNEIQNAFSYNPIPNSSPMLQSTAVPMMEDTDHATLIKSDQNIISDAIVRAIANPLPLNLDLQALTNPKKRKNVVTPKPNKKQKLQTASKEQKSEMPQPIHYIQFYSALCLASNKELQIEARSKSKITAKSRSTAEVLKINRANFLSLLGAYKEVFTPANMSGFDYNSWLVLEKNNFKTNLLITLDILKKQMLIFAIDDSSDMNPFLSLFFENEKLIAEVGRTQNSFWKDLRNIEEMTQLIQKFYCADEVLYLDAVTKQPIHFNQAYRFNDVLYNNLIKSSCLIEHEFRGQYIWNGISLNLVINRAIPYTSWFVSESKLIELFYNGAKIPVNQKYLSLRLEEEVVEKNTEKKKSAPKPKKTINTLLEIICTSDYKVGELHTINSGQLEYKSDFKKGPLSGTDVVSIYNDIIQNYLPIQKILLVDESKKPVPEPGEIFETRIAIRLISSIVNGKTFYERLIPGLIVFKCDKLKTRHDGEFTQDSLLRSLALVQLTNIRIQDWYNALINEDLRIKNEVLRTIPDLRKQAINEYLKYKKIKITQSGKKGKNLQDMFDTEEKMDEIFYDENLKKEFPEKHYHKIWEHLEALHLTYYRTARYVRLNSDNDKKLELLWQKYGNKNPTKTIKQLVTDIYNDCKKNKRDVTFDLITISKLLCDDLTWSARRNDFYLYGQAKDSFVRLKVREILWGGYYWIQDRTQPILDQSQSNNNANSSSNSNSSNNSNSSHSQQKQQLTIPKLESELLTVKPEFKHQSVESSESKQTSLQGSMQMQNPMQIQNTMHIQTPMPMQNTMHMQSPMQMQNTMHMQNPIHMQSPMQVQNPMQMQRPMQLHNPPKLQSPMQAQNPMQVQTPMQLDSSSNSNAANQLGSLFNGLTPTMFSTQAKSYSQHAPVSDALKLGTTHMQSSTSMGVLGANLTILSAPQQMPAHLQVRNPQARGLQLFPSQFSQPASRPIKLTQAMTQTAAIGAGLQLCPEFMQTSVAMDTTDKPKNPANNITK